MDKRSDTGISGGLDRLADRRVNKWNYLGRRSSHWDRVKQELDGQGDLGR